jgi:hypothetical protein
MLISAFTAAGAHSILVRTETPQLVTGIRLGNTGASQNLPRISASCNKPLNDRVDLSRSKTGSLAVAK